MALTFTIKLLIGRRDGFGFCPIQTTLILVMMEATHIILIGAVLFIIVAVAAVLIALIDTFVIIVVVVTILSILMTILYILFAILVTIAIVVDSLECNLLHIRRGSIGKVVV